MRDLIVVSAALALVACSGALPTSTDAGTASPDASRASFDGGGAQLHGTLTTGKSPIDFEGGSASVALRYKIDVDPQENGCVESVQIQGTTAKGVCALSLTFGPTSDPKVRELTAASLVLDSWCPGWPDAEEGSFAFSAATAQLATPPAITGADAGVGHVSVSLSFTGTATVTALNRSPLTLDLSGLSVTGVASVTGNTAARCVK